jgi:hypothetical protein
MNILLEISDAIDKTYVGGRSEMEKWNEGAAPNNNLSPITIQTSKQFVGNKDEHEFAEELSDGGERDQIIQNQVRNKTKPLSKIKW